MKKKIERAQMLIKLAKIKEDKNARHLASINELIHAETNKLHTLSGYRDEYLSTPLQAVTQVATLRIQSEFLSQLSFAIFKQNELLSSYDKKREKVAASWRHTYLRRRALENYLELLKIDHVKFKDTIEQKENDERSLFSSKINF